ncbi:MAG: dihydroorotate dehydrogenase electron transfer subunit [Nostocoides sp.]
MSEVPAPIAQVSATVLANRRVGAYHQLTLDAAEIAVAARPGQFVALAVGGSTSSLLLRRSFSIHRTRPETDGSVEIVVADAGPGTHWITALAPQAQVDVLGPLGRGFPLPARPGSAVLIGGGYGSAPMLWLADVLRGNGIEVHHILGAATADRLFGVDLVAPEDGLIVTTDDGSQGQRGRVTDPLTELLHRTGAATIYACGPMPMLAAVTGVAQAHGATAYVAVEEAMACGIGVCMTCVLPVRGGDGITSMTRSCTDGPIFDGGSVRWEAIANGRVAVPSDALGAPAGTR